MEINEPLKPIRRDVAVVADTSSLLQSEDSPLKRIKQQIDALRANFQVLLSPGEKQFKDLTKRVRLMIVSLLIPLCFAAAKIFIFPQMTSLFVWAGVALVLGALTYWGMIWGLKGQIEKESYISVLTLPSLLVIGNALFLSTTFVGQINRLYLWGLFTLATVVFMVLLYILALAVNILNVTLFYTIPLSRLGESVAYISGIIILFLFSYVASAVLVPLVVAVNWSSIVIFCSALAVLIFVLTSSLWFYFVPYFRGFWLYSVLVSMFLFSTVMTFTVFLPYAWLVGVISSLVGYVVYGYVIHKEQNTFKSAIKWEFLAVLVVALLAVIIA